MFQISKKQYIFQTSSGQVQNIFYKSNSGIYSSFLRGKNSWTEAAAVIKDTTPDFSACIDENDVIHIICQNTDGNIYHIYSRRGSWNLDEILKVKQPGFCIKHFYITTFDSTIFFFYVLEEKENKMLVFQTRDKRNMLSAPDLVSPIRIGANMSYRLLKYKNSLMVFYNRANKNDNGISYRTYIQSANRWSAPVDIPNEDKNEENEILSIVSDCRENIHISWQKASALKYELIYSQKAPAGELWDQKILAASPYSFYNSSILTIFDKVIAYWVRDRNIMYCISENSGEKWSGPKKYHFYPNKQLYCISYAENTGEDTTDTYFNELPGNFISGYILGFINDFSVKKEKNEDMDELKSLVVNTLKVISSSIEDVKISVEELRQRLDELELMQKRKEAQHNSFVPNPRREQPENALKSIPQEADIPDSCEAENGTKPANTGRETEKVFPDNISILPGTGFTNITPEYLRNMNKRL